MFTGLHAIDGLHQGFLIFGMCLMLAGLWQIKVSLRPAFGSVLLIAGAGCIALTLREAL